MRTRHLTRSRGAAVFQVRLPARLDPGLSISPVRVTLGHVPNSRARRVADMLGGLARVEFARIASEPMTMPPAETRRHVERLLTTVLPTLLGLGALGQSALPAEIAEEAVDGTFDLLAHVGVSRAGGGDAGTLRPEVPIAAALSSANIARGMIGRPAIREEPPPDPILTKLAVLEAKIDAKSGPRGPLFSEASARFIEGRIRTYGDPRHAEIGYLRQRSAVFLAIVGDKPVDAYTRGDLQNFVDEIAWLPPNIAKTPDYHVGRTVEYIEANKLAGGQGLAEKSVRETYLSRIKTMIREACGDAKVPVGFEGRILVPRRAAPTQSRIAPDQEEFGKVVATGVASGVLADALLPPLGLLTGRRIGLLAYMRRENILRYNGVWVCRSQSHQLMSGRWEPIPFKTSDSLKMFVLHDLLADCGFIDWAVREEGPVFGKLMKAVDPADAAQKRMARLYKSSGADPRLASTFHGLRAGKIRNDRDLDLSARAVRLQSGHELVDVHDRYDGQFTDRELRTLATAPLPPGVDWAALRTIDFEAFARRQPKGGRPLKVRSR